MVSRRCPLCAEMVSPRLLLTGGLCPQCSGEIDSGHAAELLEKMDARWRNLRLFVYLSIGVASFLLGAIPLVQSFVMIVALIGVHLGIVRRPLKFLSASRRITTRFTVKLLIVGLAAVNLIINIAVAPFFGANMVVLAILSLAEMVLFVELVTRLVRGSILRESRGEPLRFKEWWFPVFLMSGLVAVVATGLATLSAILYILMGMEIPGVSALAEFLMGV